MSWVLLVCKNRSC